jgi:pimeloyl-ACP methyl ester carboxylesterase
VVNLRGVGESSPGREPAGYTFRRHVDDLEVVRWRLGVERWVFIGSSGGGCIGLLYALWAPHALSGLIARWIGPSGRRIAADARSRLSPRHPDRQQYLLAAPLRRHPTLLHSFGATPGEWQELPENLWVLCREGQPMVMTEGTNERRKPAYEEFVSVFDVDARLGEIRTPTLVVAGACDPLVPLAECRRLHDGVPQAELVVLEETAHGDQDSWDSPDARKYLAALWRFLAGRR